MKKLIEKIIEKLEEIQIENTCSDCPHKEKCDEVQENISDEKTDLCGATIKALAIEIVKQTAAEYNNGWIPVGEELPKDGDNRYYMCIVENHEEDPLCTVNMMKNVGLVFIKIFTMNIHWDL